GPRPRTPEPEGLLSGGGGRSIGGDVTVFAALHAALWPVAECPRRTRIASPPRVPASWASQRRRKQHRTLPAVSSRKKKQRAQLKRHLARLLIKNMAVAPKSRMHVKMMTIETRDLNRKEGTVHSPEARPGKASQEESSQGPLVLSQPRESQTLSYTPVTTEQQQMASLSREHHGHCVRPNRFSSVILQPCATPGPLLLQPQVSSASNQDSVSDALEWQRKLEAAEALLALKNSSQAPTDSMPIQQSDSPPGPAGDTELQLSSPSVPSRPANSASLPTGHLDCISLLT
uniref:doublesex- and mab-3-related transcription factor C1 n=1 Tax=Jaculus jaculus TaxID=51337 RepID=UPI001E1B2031